MFTHAYPAPPPPLVMTVPAPQPPPQSITAAPPPPKRKRSPVDFINEDAVQSESDEEDDASPRNGMSLEVWEAAKEAAQSDKRRGESSTLLMLTKRFLALLRSQNSLQLNLNDAAVRLSTRKRRIYDIINVLQGAGLVAKVPRHKNMVYWTGKVDEHTPQMINQPEVVAPTPRRAEPAVHSAGGGGDPRLVTAPPSVAGSPSEVEEAAKNVAVGGPSPPATPPPSVSGEETEVGKTVHHKGPSHPQQPDGRRFHPHFYTQGRKPSDATAAAAAALISRPPSAQRYMNNATMIPVYPTPLTHFVQHPQQYPQFLPPQHYADVPQRGRWHFLPHERSEEEEEEDESDEEEE